MPFDFCPPCSARPRIRRERHPEESRLWRYIRAGDFIDGYSVASRATPDDAVGTGLDTPEWVNAAMSLRNRLVGPLGLRTGRTGEAGPLFPTTFWTAEERVIGTDDSHLDFRISILCRDGRVHMATWVHPKTTFGRAYLRAVLPVHGLITRDALRRIARHHPPAGSL